MELIIDELENYRRKKLYEYRMIFYSINNKQRLWLISHFREYSWDNGLSIAKCLVSEMPKFGFFRFFSKKEADIEFKFHSTKQFKDKDASDWTDNDLDKILDTRLIGKEQFLSNIFYSQTGLETKKVSFFDHNGVEYNVEINKYSGISKN
jgi:uncharacterized protein YqgQ